MILSVHIHVYIMLTGPLSRLQKLCFADAGQAKMHMAFTWQECAKWETSWSNVNLKPRFHPFCGATFYIDNILEAEDFMQPDSSLSGTDACRANNSNSPLPGCI